MDFTGAGGRIVTDPREAAEIAHMESRLRPTPRFTWSSSPSSDVKEDAAPAPGQAWFKPGVTRDQANNALLPHRAWDGVFLIRECSRGQGGYVISLTTQGKVVHAQIGRVSKLNRFFNPCILFYLFINILRNIHRFLTGAVEGKQYLK